MRLSFGMFFSAHHSVILFSIYYETKLKFEKWAPNILWMEIKYHCANEIILSLCLFTFTQKYIFNYLNQKSEFLIQSSTSNFYMCFHFLALYLLSACWIFPNQVFRILERQRRWDGSELHKSSTGLFHSIRNFRQHFVCFHFFQTI